LDAVNTTDVEGAGGALWWMGKVEKVVVLGVLFSVVVSLAVSFYSQPDQEEVRADLDRSARRGEPAASRLNRPEGMDDGLAGSTAAAKKSAWSPRDVAPMADVETPASQPGARRLDFTPPPEDKTAGLEIVARPQNTVPRSAGLLSSTVNTAQPKRPVGASTLANSGPLEASWDLVTTQGLTKTPNPLYQTYTCAADETFRSVAVKLYGDEKRAALLRRDNEGLDTLTAGQELLVSVIDDRPGKGESYEVQDGESLWRIAKKVYGAGSRWKEIYDANRDTLGSPDDVRAGVVLSIP
jgi:LysM repeat protein